jgi:hypothetical protein
MCLVNTDHAHAADLDMLRAVFDDKAPLGWKAVHTFEAEHEIVLPEPYRTFVAEISDGSTAGPPHYGLLPLAEHPRDWGPNSRTRDLAKPFPLTEAWIWENDPRSYEETEALTDLVFDHGSVILGTDGCGMNWHLVVSGPHRGHIWNICDVGACPFGSEFGFTTAQSGFAGWVRHWADGKEAFDAT